MKLLEENACSMLNSDYIYLLFDELWESNLGRLMYCNHALLLHPKM